MHSVYVLIDSSYVRLRDHYSFSRSRDFASYMGGMSQCVLALRILKGVVLNTPLSPALTAVYISGCREAAGVLSEISSWDDS